MHQMHQVPDRFVKFGGIVSNNDNLTDFNTAMNFQKAAGTKTGVFPNNYSSEIQLL